MSFSDTDMVIRVKNLSKCYEIYKSPGDRLKQFLLPKFCKIFSKTPVRYFREFWALQDISFEVSRGETVGIIGRNGSGKSTLLQLICGTLSPTNGVVQVKGRVAALLELGSGFNPEFTGRENVFLNASLLGMSEFEIKTRLDEIINFADIGDFIDQPVKTYSSGMMVRLAFSVQIQLRPDILIIDEALSVGDFFFQQKCFARINEMRKDGLTLLFVSHDTGTVRDLCSSSVYLQKGVMKFFGDTQMAIQAYLSENQGATPNALPVIETRVDINSLDLEDFLAGAIWKNSSKNFNESNKLIAIAILDEHKNPSTTFKVGAVVNVVILYTSNLTKETYPAISVINRFNQVVAVVGPYFSRQPLPIPPKDKFIANNIFACEINLTMALEAGQYSFNMSIGETTTPNRGAILDRVDGVGPITVTWDYESEIAPFLGQFGLPNECTQYVVDGVLRLKE